MSIIHFGCPKCVQSLDAPQELAGQLIECPSCKETIEVPIKSRPEPLQETPPQIFAQAAPPSLAKIPTFRVVPFIAVIAHDKGPHAAASQLQALIDTCAIDGWEFVRLESVETYVQGDHGCFGIGAKQPRTTIYKMAIFKQ